MIHTQCIRHRLLYKSNTLEACPWGEQGVRLGTAAQVTKLSNCRNLPLEHHLSQGLGLPQVNCHSPKRQTGGKSSEQGSEMLQQNQIRLAHGGGAEDTIHVLPPIISACIKLSIGFCGHETEISVGAPPFPAAMPAHLLCFLLNGALERLRSHTSERMVSSGTAASA